MTTTRLCVTVVLCALGFIGCARGWTLVDDDVGTQWASCVDGAGGGGDDGMFDDCVDPMEEDQAEGPSTTTTVDEPDAGCGS